MPSNSRAAAICWRCRLFGALTVFAICPPRNASIAPPPPPPHPLTPPHPSHICSLAGRVARTALEMVSKHHSLNLDPEIRFLKMRYYGGAGQGPSTMAWRPASAFASTPVEEVAGGGGGAARGVERGAPVIPASQAAHVVGKGAVEAGRLEAGRLEAGTTPPPDVGAATTPTPVASETTSPAEEARPPAEETAAEETPPEEMTPPRSIKTPVHSLTYRQSGCLCGDGGALAWSDSRLDADATRPVALALRVELPQTTSAAQVDLEIGGKRVELSEEIHGYRLELSLPYEVRKQRTNQRGGG